MHIAISTLPLGIRLTSLIMRGAALVVLSYCDHGSSVPCLLAYGIGEGGTFFALCCDVLSISQAYAHAVSCVSGSRSPLAVSQADGATSWHDGRHATRGIWLRTSRGASW